MEISKITNMGGVDEGPSSLFVPSSSETKEVKTESKLDTVSKPDLKRKWDDCEPEAFHDEPVAFRSEPVAFYHEPVTYHHQPMAFHDEAMAFHTQAMAFHDEAMAFHDEAMAFHDEAMTFHDEAMAFHHEPVAVNSEPVANNSEPVTFSSEPVTFNSQPVAINTARERPFAPAKKPPRKKSAQPAIKAIVDSRLPATAQGHTENLVIANPRSSLESPEWYLEVSKVYNGSRSRLVALEQLKTLHLRAKKAAIATPPEPIDRTIKEIREVIHRWGLADIEKPLLKKAGVLTNGYLHHIFDPAKFDVVWYPSDMQEDAFMLYQKWFAGDVDGHLLRGIKTVDGKKDTKRFRNHQVDKQYAFYKSAEFAGDWKDGYKLKNGAWWPLQVCAVRDGAHGEIEGGIFGRKGKGVFSVVVSGHGYHNIDEGDTLHYCGTSADPGVPHPTASTQMLLETQRKGQVIRVLRSHNAAKPFAPALGIRYDGLYKITYATLMNPDTNMYRFTMEREPGQSPIRYCGDVVRPSNLEIEQYRKIQMLLSGKANN